MDPRCISGVYLAYIWRVSGVYLAYIWRISGVYLAYIWRISGVYWRIFGIYLGYIYRMSGVYLISPYGPTVWAALWNPDGDCWKQSNLLGT